MAKRNIRKLIILVEMSLKSLIWFKGEHQTSNMFKGFAINRSSHRSRFKLIGAPTLIALAMILLININSNKLCDCDTKTVTNKINENLTAINSSLITKKSITNATSLNIKSNTRYKDKLINLLSDEIERQHFKLKPILKRPSKFDSGGEVDFVQASSNHVQAQALKSPQSSESMRLIEQMHDLASTQQAQASSSSSSKGSSPMRAFGSSFMNPNKLVSETYEGYIAPILKKSIVSGSNHGKSQSNNNQVASKQQGPLNLFVPRSNNWKLDRPLGSLLMFTPQLASLLKDKILNKKSILSDVSNQSKQPDRYQTSASSEEQDPLEADSSSVIPSVFSSSETTLHETSPGSSLDPDDTRETSQFQTFLKNSFTNLAKSSFRDIIASSRVPKELTNQVNTFGSQPMNLSQVLKGLREDVKLNLTQFFNGYRKGLDQKRPGSGGNEIGQGLASTVGGLWTGLQSDLRRRLLQPLFSLKPKNLKGLNSRSSISEQNGENIEDTETEGPFQTFSENLMAHIGLSSAIPARFRVRRDAKLPFKDDIEDKSIHSTEESAKVQRNIDQDLYDLFWLNLLSLPSISTDQMFKPRASRGQSFLWSKIDNDYRNNETNSRDRALSLQSINLDKKLNAYSEKLRMLIPKPASSLLIPNRARPRGVIWDMASDPSLAVTVLHLLERASVALPLGK